MKHPTQLELMLYAESFLHPKVDATALAAIADHLLSCEQCRLLTTALQSEALNLSKALAFDVNAQQLRAPNSERFRKKLQLRELTLATVVASLVTGLMQWSWKALFEELVFNALAWGTETWTPGFFALASRRILFILEKGADMLNNYLALIVTVLGVLALFCLRSVWRRPGVFPALLLTIVGSTTLMSVAPPSYALKVMSEEDEVVIAATETFNDKLVVAARDVSIHGTIEGNLFVAAENVTVRGNITGTLLAFAEDISVTGDVGGMTVAAGDSVEFEFAMLGGDLWLAGDSVELDRETVAEGNLVTGSGSQDMAGSIGRDLLAGAERVTISGDVGEDVEISARRLKVTDSAQMTGDLSYRMPGANELALDDGAIVRGEIDYKGEPENFQAHNPLIHHDFYLWSVLWFFASFLVGWLTMSMFPKLGELELGDARDSLKTAGIGLLALVSVPVVAVVIAITIVGLPLSFFALAAWLTAWYLAKIIMA